MVEGRQEGARRRIQQTVDNGSISDEGPGDGAFFIERMIDMKFEKKSYYLNNSDGPKMVEGYVYGYELPGGQMLEAGVHKVEGAWTVTDLATGATITPGTFATRALAVEKAAEYAERMEALIETDDYRKMAGEFGASLPEQKKPEIEPLPEVSLEMASKALAGIEGIEVSQKNEHSCIRVKGNTKPIKEALLAMGFRWARSKSAWYRSPAMA